MKKSTKMPFKLLSLFMAFLLIAVSVPFAFAATALKATMVTEWPTATGEMYYGQIVGEHITLSGGKVEYNGTEVPGSFVHYKDDFRPLNASDAYKANLKFVPDDSSAYTGFNKLMSADVTFVVKKTTPVWVDEADLPVATSVKSGQTLSESTISGGTMKNPYNESETGVQAAAWTWSNPDTVLTESGEYEAYYAANSKSYEIVKRNIYVEVEQDVFLTEVSVVPTIEEFTYDSDITWADISLLGGVAVVSGTDTQVEGEFAISDTWKARVPSAGSYEITVIFTPCDTEKYTSAEVKVPVTVNKSAIKFVDENGNEIVPEITVEYGTTFGDIHYYLESYVAGDDAVSIGMVGIENANKTLCKDGTYTASLINRTDSNYERTELPFKIVIKRKTLTPKLTVAVGSDGLIIRDSSGNYSPKGTFTLEYTIDGVPQEPITGIKYETAFEFNYNKSGNYEYTIIYNEAEVDEYFIIDDFTTSNPIFLTWKFSATGSVDGEYKYGDEVKLEAPATDPAKEDKPFYGFVKWEDANGNTGLTEEELSNREISFAMPDGDVDLDATYKFDFCLCIRYYIQIVVDWFNSFFQSIGTLF